MKKTTFFSMLTMLLFFVGSNAWADTYTHTFTQTEPVGTDSLSGVAWTIALDGGQASVYDAAKGAHYGTNNNTCKSVTISTDGIPGTITSVTVEASRGANLVGTLAVSVGGAAYMVGGAESTTVETTNAPYLFEGNGSGDIAIVWTTSGGKGAFYIMKITVEYTMGGIVVAKPHISPAGGVFTEPQMVTITAEEGNSVFYTLDGTDPTNGSIPYTAPFIVNTNCTVKAIAYDGDSNASSIASAEFKFPQAMNTIAEVCAAATNDKEPVLINFNNWICTGVAGSNAYFTDGKNGILLYQSNHGFAMNDVLTGTAQVTLTIYNDCPELIGLTTATEGVTVSKSEGTAPMNVIIADLEKNMQGNLITLEGVTYNAAGNVFIDDDDNEIIPYNRFIALPELMDGKTYNVTGVAIWYRNAGKWEIAPRMAEEFKLITSQVVPVSSWSVESLMVNVNDSVSVQFTTNSDGAITYASSDTLVATVNQWGKITPVAKGVCTITAYVAESETYLPDSKSFTLIVTQDGYADAFFYYNDADIVGQGAPNTGAELTATRNDVITLYANKAYAKEGDNHIKIYGSKYEGEAEERTLTEPSYIRFTASVGYSIFKIVITATEEGYIKEWTDQFGTAAFIDGATATWEGDWDEVILTNQATSQARIKSIAVTYVDVEIVDAIRFTPTLSEGDGSIYDLSGRKISAEADSSLPKGIYIIGGKKIIK